MDKQSFGAKKLLEVYRDGAAAARQRHLRGTPVQKMNGTFAIEKMTFPFPFFPCFCVQDSLTNPCKCPKRIFWMPTAPEGAKLTGSTSKLNGQDIIDFTLAREAKVVVDVQVPMDVGALNRIAATRAKGARRLRLGEKGTCIGAEGEGGNAPGYQAAPPPPLGWLALAAAVGHAAGTLLDDLLGSNQDGNDDLSDDLSDWAAEKWPAPGWLQDIF